jgi:hypothetical protein
MADQPQSTHFRARFESALQAYQKTTGITLTEHPLALQLHSCRSVESIATILKYEARTSSDLLGSDRVVESIESTISILFALSSTVFFGDAIGLVCREALMTYFYSSDRLSQPFPPAKAILAGLAVLFTVCTLLYYYLCRYPFDIQVNKVAKGVNSNDGTLVDLLESIEHFLKRVDIYTRIPLTPAMDGMMIKIILELLSTLALATKEFKHGRSSEFLLADLHIACCLTQRNAVKFFKKGEKNIEAVLQRLDRLTQVEARTTAAETLEVVHGLFRNMRVVMEGKLMHLS